MQSDSRTIGRILFLLAGILLAATMAARAESSDAANRRGEQLLNRGLYAKAIEAFSTAIEIGTKAEGSKGTGVLRARHNLAQAYGADGQFALAEQNFQESFEGMMEAFKAGRGRVSADEVGWVMVNWAGNSYNLAQFVVAEQRTLAAIKIFEDNGLTESAISARHNLASIYSEQKNYDKALKEYEGVLDYRLKRFGARDGRYANALAGPGVVYLKLKDYPKAESFFRRCIQGQVAALGRDGDPETEQNLAYTLVGEGQFDEAKGIYERLMMLADKRYGLPYRVAGFKGNLASIAAYQDQWDKALKLTDESERFVIPYRRNMVLGMSDSELLSYMTLLGGADDAVSIGWARHKERGVPEMAAGWSINSRGLLYESMAERLLLARDSRLSGQAALFGELGTVRKQYSSLLQVGRGTKSQNEYIGEMTRLMEREADLTRRIGLASKRTPPKREYTEVSALRKSLDAETVLIHFEKTELRDFGMKGSPQGSKIEPHYLAWIIPPAGKGEVSMLDIGPAAGVEAAMKKWDAEREGIEAAREDYNGQIAELRKQKMSEDEISKRVPKLMADFRAREAGIEKEYRAGVGRDISKLLLHPLLPAAGSFKKWILCPDADLWLLPWNALVLPDGRYFIEQYALTHVVTPRDLAATAATAGVRLEPGPPIVISAPNYDLGIKVPEDRAQSVSLIQGFGKAWVDKLLPDLEFFARAEPQVFIGDTATEDVIKKARSPRVLFLSTHGMFGKIDPAKMPPGYRFLKESPLVRCVLTFAGCNKKHPPEDAGEDGFLFGSELLGCDLRATELVLLTACQTAQGDVHAGQSAAGMRQAFQLAGARDVIATLWSVDQKASKRFVEEFMALIGQTIPPLEALRAAQLEVLRTADFRHPFYWAAFTMTGRGF